MVVKAKSGRTIEINLDVNDPEHRDIEYHMSREIRCVDDAKREVDAWWKHIVKMIEWQP